MIDICSRIAAPLAAAACLVAGPASAEDLEEIVGQHMVAEALLTAHLVAIAEEAGLGNEVIRAILKDVADNSVIDEFWITDPEGHAVLANREVSFTFSPDPVKQPQVSAFWPLLTGEKKVVIQKAQSVRSTIRSTSTLGWPGLTRHASCRSVSLPLTSPRRNKRRPFHPSAAA